MKLNHVLTWRRRDLNHTKDPISFSLMRPLRLIMYLIISGSYLFGDTGLTEWQTEFVIIAIIVFILTHVLHFSNKTKQYYFIWSSIDFVLTTLFGIIFPTSTIYQISFGIIFITLFLFTNDRRILNTAGVSFGLVWIILWIIHYSATGRLDLINMLMNLGFVANSTMVGALVSHLIRARSKLEEQYEKVKESHMALQDAHDQLREYSQQVEELTSIRERNQIAREIHDTVGHTMTALIVQLQGARMLQERVPAQAEAALSRCEELARSALQEVRLSVRALRDDREGPVTVTDVLRRLIKDFSEMSQMQISLAVEGDVSLIPTSLQPTIYRLIQESLTNAKRHGEATQAYVSIRSADNHLQIGIEDNGRGVAEVVPGFGLINMRERVMEHGGSIYFDSESGSGFRVHITFPLDVRKWTYGGASL